MHLLRIRITTDERDALHRALLAQAGVKVQRGQLSEAADLTKVVALVGEECGYPEQEGVTP